MEKIQVERIDAIAAAQKLAGIAHLDPCGMMTENDFSAMTQAGQCFAATSDTGEMTYVIKIKNGVAWVSALKGSGSTCWMDMFLPMVEAQAVGCKSVGFQTTRGGIVKKALKQGYRITGWIVKKDLQK